jgi:hypothetical protein
MSITVKQLREALAQFRDDAVCYAYEGEVTGIIISPPGGWGGPGVIHCSEGFDNEPLRVDVFPEVAALPATDAEKP